MAKELEFKVLTTAEEFHRCRALLQARTGSPGDGYVQVNYYFDTPDFAMADGHSMLRVRSKKNSLRLQYKNKRKRLGSMLLCEEREAKLKKLPKTVKPSDYFEDAPAVSCSLLGNLVTYRTDFVFPGAVVSLDESQYFGKTDYEIEIEGEEDAITLLAEWLAPQGESKKGNGKFSRFLKAYKKYYGD